jgi:preprotein translocase subunit SecE
MTDRGPREPTDEAPDGKAGLRSSHAPDRKSRPAPGSDVKKEKTGPRQYLSEVRAELKKVAWPTKKEVTIPRSWC